MPSIQPSNAQPSKPSIGPSLRLSPESSSEEVDSGLHRNDGEHRHLNAFALPDHPFHLTAADPCITLQTSILPGVHYGDGRAHVRFNILLYLLLGPGTLGPSLFNRWGSLWHGWRSLWTEPTWTT